MKVSDRDTCYISALFAGVHGWLRVEMVFWRLPKCLIFAMDKMNLLHSAGVVLCMRIINSLFINRYHSWHLLKMCWWGQFQAILTSTFVFHLVWFQWNYSTTSRFLFLKSARERDTWEDQGGSKDILVLELRRGLRPCPPILDTPEPSKGANTTPRPSQ